MEKFDTQADCVRALQTQGRRPKRNGELHRFNCLRHDDRNGDAWVGVARWGCFACAFEEPIATLCEHLGVAPPAGAGFTVEDLCERKRFSLDVVTRHGWKTTAGQYGDVVEMPYLDAEGKTLRPKLRGRKGSWWKKPGTGTYLYGLHVLAKADPNADVILAEGETDPMACWHKGILCLGVPGATAWKRDWAPLLAGRSIYIWQEPGSAAVEFVHKIAADFPKAKIIRGGDGGVPKDLAELFKQDPKGFKATVEALKATALPFGAEPPRTTYTPLLGGVLAHIGERKLYPVDAVPTPLKAWNRECRDEGGGIGLARGWNTIVAGNTGTGKSLLGLNLAATALQYGETVAYHSLEMSRDQLATRVLAIVSGISVRRLEHGQEYSREDWATASLRMEELRERFGGFLCTNEGVLTRLGDVVDAIKRHTEYQGCRYHVVDYLQLCRVAGTKDVIEAVPVVSGAMRELAKELNVVMVGLSQFNRETSKNRDQKPQVQGLMGGSPLENDADQVILLNHAKYVKNGHTADTEVLLAKNRHGSTEDIPVRWDHRTLTITEAAGDPLGRAA